LSYRIYNKNSYIQKVIDHLIIDMVNCIITTYNIRYIHKQQVTINKHRTMSSKIKEITKKIL
jgi:hypothetical protein